MTVYECFRKGPPRWLVHLIIVMAISVAGIEFGKSVERGTQAGAVVQAEIDRLKALANNVQFDLDVEREKLAVLVCESGIRHDNVWGDSGKSFGIAQFQQKTFKMLAAEAGKPRLQWKRRADQLWLLDWAIRRGYGSYWSCFDAQRNGLNRKRCAKHADGFVNLP